MSAPLSAFQAVNGAAHNGSASNSPYTVNGLKRWSCAGKDLPKAEDIKTIHVYDFDNTLFRSPLPNPQLWRDQTGFLQAQEPFANGGWWHNPDVLAATGEGAEKEEPRAWEGFWNESIVSLVKLSMEQTDALTVLLTGRSEQNFADLVNRMVRSKGLEFDIVALKPAVGPNDVKFSSTMIYKQAFLDYLLNTYNQSTEFRIYEDREKHVEAFQKYIEDLNEAIATGSSPRVARTLPIHGDVIEVAEQSQNLDPVREVALVQNLVNDHNNAFRLGKLAAKPRAKPYTLKRTVLFTGYLISPEDSSRLLAVAGLKRGNTFYRTLANNIMITPRAAPAPVLQRIGGVGTKVRWRVVATGIFENKIWGARVEPVVPNTPIHTDSNTPSIVLALKENAKPFDVNRIAKWTNLAAEKVFEFDATIGEKAVLRIEEEPSNPRPQASTKRPLNEGDFPALQAPTGPKERGGFRGGRGHFANAGGRGGAARGGARGGRGGGASGPRGGKRGGRGGYPNYHSLDDVGVGRGGRPSGPGGFEGAGDDELTY